MPIDQLQLRAIRENSEPIMGSEAEYRPLMDLIGDSRLVLIGEASHGTHEFYHMRASLTRRLIEEKGFTAVAAEADWPDAHRVNRYVLGRGADQYAVQALDSFRRFPAWMWRNSDVLEFVSWLRDYNDSLPNGTRTSTAWICTASIPLRAPCSTISTKWIAKPRSGPAIVTDVSNNSGKTFKPMATPRVLA